MAQKTWTFTLRGKLHSIAVAHIPSSGKGGIWVNGMLHRQKYTRFEPGSEHPFYITDVPFTIHVTDLGYELRVNGHRFEDAQQQSAPTPKSDTTTMDDQTIVDSVQQRRRTMHHQAKSMKAETVHTNQALSMPTQTTSDNADVPIIEEVFSNDPLLSTKKLTSTEKQGLEDTLILNEATSFDEFLSAYEQAENNSIDDLPEDTNPTWFINALPNVATTSVESASAKDEKEAQDTPHIQQKKRRDGWFRGFFTLLGLTK